MTDTIKVLLVEDNPADVELTREALGNRKLFVQIDAVTDGALALDYLHQRGLYAGYASPDVIILDLNVPRLNGKDVLAEIKSTEVLKRIPVVVLTTSTAEQDIVESYDLGANCYVSKPLDFTSFQSIVHSLEAFWFTVVKLPPSDAHG